MGLDIYAAKGTPVEHQRFDWREMAGKPISKLDDDTFTRIRIVLMDSLELESQRFQLSAQWVSAALAAPLATIRRAEHHQAATIKSLLGADHSLLELSVAHAQAGVETTAALASAETDAAVAAVYRLAALEELDNLYRFCALLDRAEGKDPNNILQGVTPIVPGRPAALALCAEQDNRGDAGVPGARAATTAAGRLRALTALSLASRANRFYLDTGPLHADPAARMLYAEIASIEEQHATRYAALLAGDDSSGSYGRGYSVLGDWLLHEAMEVYHYHGCLQQESNPRVKALWERFLDYELGHFHQVAELFAAHERRDPRELVPAELPETIGFAGNRQLLSELMLSADLGTTGGDASRGEPGWMNAGPSPGEAIAAGYVWARGTELNRRMAAA